jgi:MFS family permease
LYLLVILGWIFTMTPERHSLTIPLLIILHIFAGVASGGVTLTTSTIGLKIAPGNQATAYLSGVTLSVNMGSGLGPILGGFLADFFSTRQFLMTFTWTDPTHSMQFSMLSITGFSFLFAIAFILGIFTLSLLANLREEGEVSREVVLESLMMPMRELYRPVTSILPYYLAHMPVYRVLKRIPIPGLDVALSVIAYQIADILKVVLQVC